MGNTRSIELELLSPARNYDIGIAAIDCGADAVYIAGPQFGARHAAGNRVDDIRRLCEYAHRFGARIFITLNTILYDGELAPALEQMLAVRKAGADAIIVQDLAVLEMAVSHGIPLPLHASTQCAIRTPEQARFYESLGFSRLILERELSIEQIRSIREAVSCELEFFVHGALCVCYSGQCYMSEAVAGRSANRGACIQACRSLYDLADRDGNILVSNKALLSLKDFNLHGRLAELADAGITSFKIEGRLKNISYVKNVVRGYSQALDSLAGTPCDTDSQDGGIRRSGSGLKFCRASFGRVSGGFTPNLDKTFNRGYTELFIGGKRGQWSTFDAAKGMGEEIGTVSSLNREKNRFTITRPEGISLNNGDGLSFVARNSEVVGFRADICNGSEIRCKSIPELFVGARIFRNIDLAFEKEIENNTPVREIRVMLHVDVHRATVSVHAASEDGREIRRDFEAGTQKAENQERMRTLFESQLSKSAGHYRFSVSGISCPSGLPFMPVSALNKIRREIAEDLDLLPCNRRPLENRTLNLDKDLSARLLESVPPLYGQDITYKSNVANSIAEKIYRIAGAGSIGKAYELEHPAGAELMRTRYCIRHELGLCPRQRGKAFASPATAGNSDLYLLNNGRRFTLRFDCARCEMTVSYDIQ